EIVGESRLHRHERGALEHRLVETIEGRRSEVPCTLRQGGDRLAPSGLACARGLQTGELHERLGWVGTVPHDEGLPSVRSIAKNPRISEESARFQRRM